MSTRRVDNPVFCFRGRIKMSEADGVAELMRMYQKLINERNKNNENKSEIVINYFVVRVSDWATCNFLSPNLRIQTDANTQWYKASIITSQMNDTHTWTDWKIVDEPTCTEDGKQVRRCTACGFTENCSGGTATCSQLAVCDVCFRRCIDCCLFTKKHLITYISVNITTK